MFCRKCGNVINDGDFFCKHCGVGTTGDPPQAVTSEKSAPQSATQPVFKRDAIFYGTVGIAALMLLLMITNWISIPAVGSLSSLMGVTLKSDYTIFNFAGGLARIGDLLGDASDGWGILVGITYILAGVCVLAILVFARALYKLFVDVDRGVTLINYGNYLALVLSAVFIVAMFFVDNAVSEETYGFLENPIDLTASPYFVLIGSLICKIVLLKRFQWNLWRYNQAINEYVATKASGGLSSSAEKNASTTSNQRLWECKKCKSMNRSSSLFCTNCGQYK